MEGRRLHRLVDTHFELSDTLHLKGRLKFDEYERPIEEVAGTFNRKERFLMLAPGHVGLLPPLNLGMGRSIGRRASRRRRGPTIQAIPNEGCSRYPLCKAGQKGIIALRSL